MILYIRTQYFSAVHFLVNSCINKNLLFVVKNLFYYQNFSSLVPSPSIHIFTLQPDFDSSVTAPVNYTYKNHIQYFHIKNASKFRFITIIKTKFLVYLNDKGHCKVADGKNSLPAYMAVNVVLLGHRTPSPEHVACSLDLANLIKLIITLKVF